MRSESSSAGDRAASIDRVASSIRWATVLVAACVAGGLVAICVPLVDQVAVTFEVPAFEIPSSNVDLEHELHAFALSTATPERVWTRASSAGRVQVLFETSSRVRKTEFVAFLSRGFAARVAELAETIRRTPTSAESVLEGMLTQQNERLQDARKRLDAAASALPPSDPQVNREALRMRWEMLRADWTGARQTLSEAATQAERLRSQPDLNVGNVDPQERRKALESDAALQQDLKELAVRLAEIKLHLLNVWQQSAGRLDELRSGSEAFAQLLAGVDLTPLPQAVAERVGRISGALDAYRRILEPFQAAWTAEFTAIQHMEVDPQRGEILDRQERIRSLLSDFLFSGSKSLGTLRTELAELSRDPSDNSRHHVLESNLTRGFQAVQSVHHRFEFAAATLDTPDNFRLDASLRSARGLRRRSLERTQGIESRLEKEAAVRAKQQRVETIVQAERTVEQLRLASEHTVAELFDVQAGFFDAGKATEDFLRAALSVEVLAQTVRSQQEQVAALETRHRELEAERIEEATALHAEFVSSEFVAHDYQWGLRVRVGLAAGVASFLAAFIFRRRAAH